MIVINHRPPPETSGWKSGKGSVCQSCFGTIAKVYPMIGNHDVHFYGCTFVETHIIEEPECHFGTALDFLRASKYEMSFDTWRNNWLQVCGLDQQHSHCGILTDSMPHMCMCPSNRRESRHSARVRRTCPKQFQNRHGQIV